MASVIKMVSPPGSKVSSTSMVMQIALITLGGSHANSNNKWTYREEGKLAGVRGRKEGVEIGKYSQNALYTCMKLLRNKINFKKITWLEEEEDSHRVLQN